MKKIIIFLSFLLCIFNVNAISASSYIVYNMDNDEVLMGNSIHSPRLIASVSKIMTCIIAIEKGNLTDEILIDVNTLKTTGSSLYLSINEKITLKDLLYGLMLRSGNDAAMAISYYIANSMEDFANIMNEYAKKIGMNDSYFYNSHGLELESGIGNISSPYDLAILTKYAMNNSIFREIFHTKKYICKTNMKTYHWTNKNKLLKYDYISGGKTGYTIKAKRTLVTTGIIHNQNIVIVTLNDYNDFNDHLNIYNYLLNNYEYYKVLDKNDIKKIYGTDYYIKNDYYIFVNKEDIDNIKVEYHFGVNDKTGYIDVLLDNKIIHKEELYKRQEQQKWYQKIWNHFISIFK